MICCLNPDCLSPLNPDGTRNCQSCRIPLIPLLRGHYRITRLLSNEGGFGRTYLAEDVDKLEESCVVKQLAPKAQGTSMLNKAVELFQEEAKRLQELGKHQQIPTLSAYFKQDNYLYLVQEFIDGQNLLMELQQRTTYNETEIREFMLDLLPVLKFIHERRVIHRDIKPANIMHRQSDGKLVLIDFGASKQLTETVRTKPGTIIGTRGYSPLEQMRDGEAYPASDLFSLGATCFHLLTGVSPVKLWTEQGYAWVASWQQYLKNPVSNEFSQVLNRLLKRDIQERYQSADEVIRDLIQQIPTEVSVSQPSQKQHTKLRNGLIAATAILLLGFGGVWYVTHPNDTHPSSPSPTNTTDTSLQPRTLNGHSNLVSSVAISPNGITLVSGSYDTTLKVWNLANGMEINTLDGNAGSVHSVAIDPNGVTLASGNGNNTIQLWNLLTGQQMITPLKGHSSSVESVAISRDGKMLASGSFDGTIKLWSLPAGMEINSIKGHSSSVKSLAFAPEGETLASGSEDNTIKLWNLANKQVIHILKEHSKAVQSVAFSSDGKTLASGSSDNTIKLWNPATGMEIKTLKGHSHSVNSVAFSFDGKTLASGSSDNTIKLWDLATKNEIRSLNGHSKEVISVAFSPDNKTLASGSADGTINIWRLSP